MSYPSVLGRGGQRSDRRGFTLAELCVVLALLAIVSTMIVTFCILISERTKRSAEEKNFSDDRTTLCSRFDEWIASLDASDTVFSFKNQVLTATVGKNEYKFSVTGNNLCITCPDVPESTLSLSESATMTVEILCRDKPTAGSANALITCQFCLDNGTTQRVFTLRKAIRAAKAEVSD